MRKQKTVESLTPLGEKLCAIRMWLDMAQEEILPHVHPEMDTSYRSLVSQWEKASREPRRHVLLRYAKLAPITLDELMNDDIPLPAHITLDYERFGGDIRKKREWEANNPPPAAGLEVEAETGTTVPATADRQADDEAAVTNESNQMPTTLLAQEEKREEKQESEPEKVGTSVGDKRSDERQVADHAENRLAFLIGDSPTEAITLDLAVETLDRLDDAQLSLLSRLPRPLRPYLTIDSIVNYCTNVFLKDYEERGEDSRFSEQIRLLIEASKFSK